MSNYDPNHPLSEDKELEDALAFVANLRKKEMPLPTPAKKETPAPVEEAPAPVEEKAAADTGMVSFAELAAKAAPYVPPVKREPVEEEKPAPRKKSLGKRMLHAVIPFAGDPWWDIARKLAMLVALVVFIGSMAMLINESVIIPQQNEQLAAELESIRQGNVDSELLAEVNKYEGYPEGINSDLKTLYYLNHDLRGWVTYTPCGINREVMYSGDDKYYLDHDFYKNYNKNGALFFDPRNDLSNASAYYKSLVIYGHNMASGQMFAQLNELAKGVDVMKRANAPVKLDTLFSTAQYKIFAVVLQDSRSKIEHYFSVQETHFPSSKSFMKYVDGLRARSLYDFPDVDVKESDDILIMYTCTPKSIAHFDEARLAVVARRVRQGESASVSSANITVNKDVIMPYAWYTAQKKKPHSFYETGELPVGPTTTTKPSDGTTTENGGDTTTTTEGQNGETPTGPGSVPPTAPPTNPTPGGSTTPPASQSGTTTQPANGSTTTPPAGSTTEPPAESTTEPPAGETTTADGEATTTEPPAEETTTEPPAEETTTEPPVEETTTEPTEETATTTAEPAA
ncbi:MAG: sortase [Clostridia bacterium]|nr:sortase [Clostridia bacterium]